MAQENRQEDLSFPVSLLYRAYDILEKEGKGKFRAYVQKIDMPSHDIERILCKYNYKHDPEFRKKIDQKFGIISSLFKKGKVNIDLGGLNVK
jgi:hypothetical protein